MCSKGDALEKAWKEKWNNYQLKFPKLAKEYERRIHKKLPENWTIETKRFIEKIYKFPL